MQLIVDGVFTDDGWQQQSAHGHSAPPQIAAQAGAGIVDLPLPWITHWFWRRTAAATGIGIGVEPDTPPALLMTNVLDIALIGIAFATLGDGRGFSLAHGLREHGFTGELRAFGALIPDQYQALRQSGFDDIMIENADARRHTQATWRQAASNPTQTYVPVWRQPARHRGGAGYPESILARRYQDPRSA